MSRHITCSLVLSAIMTMVARAGLTNLEIAHNAEGTIAGYVVNDVSITFTGEWTGAQLLTTAMPMAIHQHALGGDTPPNATLLGLFPNLAYDSFMANGGKTMQTDNGVLVVGGAVNLNGFTNTHLIFSRSKIDATWAPQTGVHPTDLSDYFIGRFTLSENANGAFKILIATADMSTILEGTILDGQMRIVPEPATLGLLALLAAGVLKRGRSATRSRRG